MSAGFAIRIEQHGVDTFGDTILASCFGLFAKA
jgi:hypothetical protein